MNSVIKLVNIRCLLPYSLLEIYLLFRMPTTISFNYRPFGPIIGIDAIELILRMSAKSIN